MLRRTAGSNVAYALRAAGRAAEAAIVTRLLDRVGLAALADRPARKLSGGEQQRLALARALARDPEVLFLDEPTASLDPAATKSVEDIVAAAAAGGVKIVMSTHDLGQARRPRATSCFSPRAVSSSTRPRRGSSLRRPRRRRAPSWPASWSSKDC